MTLAEWLTQSGTNATQRLATAAGVSVPTIYRARERRATLESAEKIHAATGGAVELWHMTTARDVPPTNVRRRRAVAR